MFRKFLFALPALIFSTMALADFSGPTTQYTGVYQGGPPQTISVMDARIGAKCDGTTDDSAAFVTAQTIAGIGGTITIPSNAVCRGKIIDTVAGLNWVVNGTVKGPDGMTGEVFQCSATNVTITGAGTIDADRAAAGTSSISIYGNATDGCSHFTVTIANAAHAKNNAGSGGYGIQILDVPYATVSGVYVTDVGNIGIFANLTGSANVAGLSITNNQVDRTAEGTNLTGGGIQIKTATTSPTPATYRWTGAVDSGNRVYLPFNPLNSNIGNVLNGANGGVYANNFTSGSELAHSLPDNIGISVTGNSEYGGAGYGLEIARSHAMSVAGTSCYGATYADTLQHCVVVDGYSSHVSVAGTEAQTSLSDTVLVSCCASLTFSAAASNGGLIQLTMPSTAGLIAGADGTPLDVAVTGGDTGPQGRHIIQSVDDATHITLASTTFVATSSGTINVVVHDISVAGVEATAQTSNGCITLKDVASFSLSGINCGGAGNTSTSGVTLNQSWQGTVSGNFHDLSGAVKITDAQPDTVDDISISPVNFYNNTNNFTQTLSNGAVLGSHVSLCGTGITSGNANWLCISDVLHNTIIASGTGSPKSSVTGGIGSLYQENATGQLYYNSTGTLSGWTPITQSSGNSAIQTPAGRLTLECGKPVMDVDAIAATTICLDTYLGNLVPVYDGNNWNSLTITASEISMGLDAVTPHIASGNLYDVFAISNSGSLALCAGPAWTTPASSRGTGAGTTQLSHPLAGIYTNTVDLTHCWGGASGTTDYGTVSAGTGTYLGTFGAIADGTTQVNLNSAAAAGGSNTGGNYVGLWNMYNRVSFRSCSRDNTTTWTNASSTWAPADAGATGSGLNNRINFVDGQNQSQVIVQEQVGASVVGTTANIGVNLDSASNTPANVAATTSTSKVALPYQYATATSKLGLHYYQFMENSGTNAATVTYAGNLVGCLQATY